MQFINSPALWGGLAALGVGVPILIHLFNRFKVKRVAWGAMALLRRTQEIRSRRVKLEDFLVLALRCLALALVALALLRPASTSDAAWVGEKRAGVVVALDASYSMAAGPLTSRFQRARRRAEQIFTSVPKGSPVSLMLLGRQPRVIVRKAPCDPASLERLLREVQILPEAAALEPCLETLRDLVREIDLPARECHVLTDSQAATWKAPSPRSRELLTEIAGLARLHVTGLSGGSVENLTVSGLRFGAGGLRKGATARFAADVRNQGTSPAVAQIRLDVDGKAEGGQAVGPLGPGELQTVYFDVPLERAGPLRLAARLDEDGLGFDNVSVLAVDVPEEIQVLCVDGDALQERPDRRETYYLTKALQLQRSGAGRGLRISTVTPQELEGHDFAGDDIVCLANVGEISASVAERLTQVAQRGKGLLVFVGDKIDPARAGKHAFLPVTFGEPTTPEAGRRLDVKVRDTGHPVGHELARLGERLEDVAVGGFVPLIPLEKSRTILELSDGAPFLVEGRLGKGRVLICATSADRDWSNLPVTAVYPVLLHSAVAHLTACRRSEAVTVGEPLDREVETAALGAALALVKPDGSRLVPAVERDGARSRVSLGLADQPGFFTLTLAEDVPPLILAANVDPREGDPRRLDEPAFREALQGTGAQVSVIQADAAAPARPSTASELWRILAIAGLLALLGQGLLSDRISGAKA
jgi:hypothetical protein